MNWLTQIISITLMNAHNITARKSASIVAIAGIAGVVTILVGVLSIREGFRATLELAGTEDVAIVLRSGSADELSSSLSQEQTQLIAAAQGVAHNNNQTMASPELYVVVDVPNRKTGTPANVPLRGVGSQAAPLRQHFKLTSGRMFIPGRFEVIAGRGAAQQFAGLYIGNRLHWGTTDWEVVGLFEDAGSVSESELWTDAALLQNAYQRGNRFQSVRVKLTSANALQTFKDALSLEPRLSVNARTEREYYAEQSRALSTLITSLGYTIATLMGLGAIFAALNTMYAAVSTRTREIATLRALGFGSIPVVISVLSEALLLGLIGGVIGCVLAYWGFNGIRTSTLNFANFSQVTFAFAVTPKLLLQGMFYALLLAFIGGILPGLRATRMSIVQGLREL